MTLLETTELASGATVEATSEHVQVALEALPTRSLTGIED